MQCFDLNEIAPRPWKNGGGSTREIACWPQGADMDSFGWRVSIATIAQAGPFSAFPGINRQIMLLAGDGVQLLVSITRCSNAGSRLHFLVILHWSAACWAVHALISTS